MKAFEQVDGLQKSRKSVSQDDIAALEDARKRILSLIPDNETISSMTEGYDLADAIRMVWDQGKADARSVYRIYNLMKKRIPAIIKAGDGITANAEYIEKTGEENIFETKLGRNTARAIKEAVDQRNMAMASAEELSNALRSLDKDEYERQTSRMHKKHKGLKELYKEYRNAEENLKTAKAGGDRQAVEKYRAEAEKCETVYVQRFIDCSNIEVERSATGFYKNIVLSRLRGFQGRKEYIGLKDFATVMGLCCKDNISRLVAFKIDMKLALELNSMRVLNNMEEKAIKAQEAALKKGDPESLKEAKRIQEEFEAKRKEIEEEKKRKMEEKPH